MIHMLAQHWAERWVPGSLGLMITGLPFIWLLRLTMLGYASRNWPTVVGTITESRYVERIPWLRIVHGFAYLSYRYEVDGEVLYGRNLKYGHGIEASPTIARGVLSQYPLGADVLVRVREKESVILPGPSGWLFVYMALCLLGFGSILYGLATGT